MAKLIVLLSGPVASGKSSLAHQLEERFGFIVIKTWQLLKSISPSVRQDRESLQRLGERLDKKTGGRWVIEELDKVIRNSSHDACFVVDAVRFQGQVDFIHQGFGRIVKHIHLHAPHEALAARYQRRHPQAISEFESYDEVLKSRTERVAVPKLSSIADIVVDTTRNTPGDVLVRAACHLGLYGRGYERVVDVLVGGQYGSEGKGQVAAYLAPEYDVLVRVGGPNAGHKVFEEPEPFTFHSLPSGSRSSNAHIVLGAGAIVNAENLWAEINNCQLEPSRLTIDPNVVTITDEDIAREAENVATIGSTGQGVGSATARRILDRGVRDVEMAKNVKKLLPYVKPACEVIERACRESKKVFLEGTQGTALSLYHGHYPFVTSRDTTVAGCLAEAGISPCRVRKVVMVCRTYPIRVQNPDREGQTSGPMKQELTMGDIASRSGIDPSELEKTETTSTTKRKRRISEFDWQLLRRASELNAPSDIALTFVDYLSKQNRDARRFEQLTSETVRFIQEIERVSEARVSLIATRFHHRAIIDRRFW